ncbi:hypothetical protein ACU6U9_10220 [Pseudomonas sp. HK3]
MKLSTTLTFILFSLFLSGCSVLQAPQQDTIATSWNEPHKFYFQGKGAGAGMALMATMGAMGMAIGVAIDEGISKDISKTQQASGKTVKDLLNEINSTSGFHINWQNTNNNTLPSLVIERIGFNIVRGGNDATGVKIKALYTDIEGKKTQLNYPKDSPEYKAQSFPLEQLKTNSKLANQLLIEGFEEIFKLIKNKKPN